MYVDSKSRAQIFAYSVYACVSVWVIIAKVL